MNMGRHALRQNSRTRMGRNRNMPDFAGVLPADCGARDGMTEPTGNEPAVT